MAALGCAAASGLTPRVHAAVARRLTLTELVAGTCHIVAGGPLLAESHWETMGVTRRIVTDWLVRVEEPLDDRSPPAEVIVRTLGGVVGDVGQRVAGQADLAVGRRTALFLCEPRPEIHAVFGWAQGAYAIGREAGGVERLRAHRRGLHLVGAPSGKSALELLDRLTIGQAREAIGRELSRRAR